MTPGKFQEQQQLHASRLKRYEEGRSRFPFDLMPRPGTAPDAQSDPELNAGIIAVDPRLIGPHYAHVDAHNERLVFAQVGYGQQHVATSSFYTRATGFMTEPQRAALTVGEGSTTAAADAFAWAPLGQLYVDLLAPLGARFCAGTVAQYEAQWGRLLPHQDLRQFGTWKIINVFSSKPTETLIFKNGVWYALRFPAGGAAYILQSELLGQYWHAVPPSAAHRHSVVLVFLREGSTRRGVLDRLATMGAQLPALPGHNDQRGGREGEGGAEAEGGGVRGVVLRDWTMQPAPTSTPWAAKSGYIGAQVGNDIGARVKALGESLQAMAPAETRLARAPRAQVYQAIERLPHTPQEQAVFRDMYEKNVKRPWLASFGTEMGRAHQLGVAAGGTKRRKARAFQELYLSGVATTPDGHTMDFAASAPTPLYVPWKQRSVFEGTISTASANPTAQNLARLYDSLGMRPKTATLSSKTFGLSFSIGDGNEIVGVTAKQLRALGLQLRAVGGGMAPSLRLGGLPRASETANPQTDTSTSSSRRPRKAYLLFVQEFYGTRASELAQVPVNQRLNAIAKEYARLSPVEKQALQARAAANQRNSQKSVSGDAITANAVPASAALRVSASAAGVLKSPGAGWKCFSQEHFGAVPGPSSGRLKVLSTRWNLLSDEAKQVYHERARLNREVYRAKRTELLAAQAALKAKPKPAPTPFEVFEMENVQEAEDRSRKRSQLKSLWRSMSDTEQRAYDDKAEQLAAVQRASEAQTLLDARKAIERLLVPNS